MRLEPVIQIRDSRIHHLFEQRINHILGERDRRRLQRQIDIVQVERVHIDNQRIFSVHVHRAIGRQVIDFKVNDGVVIGGVLIVIGCQIQKCHLFNQSNPKYIQFVLFLIGCNFKKYKISQKTQDFKKMPTFSTF